MKPFFLRPFCLLLAMQVLTPLLAGDIDDIEDLAKTGVSEEVLLAYVDASDDSYDMNADAVLRLNDVGVPQSVIAAMIKRSSRHQEKLADKDEDYAPEPETEADDASYASADAVVAPPESQQDVSFFYDALAPYGNWIQEDGNSFWRPTLIDTTPEWTPYFHGGNWVWSDQGWCWASEYSWGWAPFHYGRWRRHNHHGWVWHADVTWGPAWVSWRQNDDYFGWAPLPPLARYDNTLGLHVGGKHFGLDINLGLGYSDYSFVPSHNFMDRAVWRYGLRRGEVRSVFERTTYIEKSITYRNNRIWGGGPQVEVVRRVTRREVTEVRISDVSYRTGTRIRGDYLSGSEFHVYRPQLREKPSRSVEDVVRARDTRLEQIKTRQLVRDARTSNIEQARQNVADRRSQRLKLATDMAAQRRDARTENVVNHQAAIQARREAVRQTQQAAAEGRADLRTQRVQQREVVQKTMQEHHEDRIEANRSAAEEHRKAAQQAAQERHDGRDEQIEQHRAAIQQHREAATQARQGRQSDLQAHHEAQIQQRQVMVEQRKEAQKVRVEAVRDHHEELARTRAQNAQSHEQQRKGKK